jgi:two-component system sensor histidine kinase ArlS
MSRIKTAARVFAYIIKTTASILARLLKQVLPLIPRLLGELSGRISNRLRFSLTFKTTLTYTLLFITILITLGTLLTGAFATFLLYSSGQALEKNNLVVVRLMGDGGDIPRETIKHLADVEKLVITLYDQNGQAIYGTDEEKTGASSAGRINLYGGAYIDSGLGHLYYQTTVFPDNGVRKIETMKPLTDELLYLQYLMASIAIAFTLAVLIMIRVGARTSRRMLSPINTMTRTARSISVGDLDTRLDVVDSHDELKELAVTFNEMLDRIQTSFEKQEVFVSDASHELRTPISVIQGYANLLQRWGKEDREVLQESIDAIKSESDYMKELVEKLLFLASADKKKQALQTEPFALNLLVEEVIKETGLIDAEHRIEGEARDTLMVDGDRALIKQALRIFVDNSVKYTPAGGTISINGSLKSGRALIIIEDTGQGIAEADLPLIFDRFYKADKSRTRESGGAGLGLSIAKWIIDQHRGDIWVQSRVGQGTKISIYLPALKK